MVCRRPLTNVCHSSLPFSFIRLVFLQVPALIIYRSPSALPTLYFSKFSPIFPAFSQCRVQCAERIFAVGMGRVERRLMSLLRRLRQHTKSYRSLSLVAPVLARTRGLPPKLSGFSTRSRSTDLAATIVYELGNRRRRNTAQYK